MSVKCRYRKLHTLVLHAIICITCSSASQCLRDFRPTSDSFDSQVLATSVELVQTETELSFLQTNVVITATDVLI